MQHSKQVKMHMEGKMPHMTFEKWDNGNILHCFTTKLGGISTGDLESLNLGFNRGDDTDKVVENYRRVCELLDTSVDTLVLSRQVHETHIKEVTKEDCGNGIVFPNQWESVDGLYTRQKGVTLVTHYADCVPLFFYAPKYGMIGMAHAGWRGTVQEIGKKMIKIWHEEHKIPLKDIEVGIGPSIGPCCFEVHADVADAFNEKFGTKNFIVKNTSNGKYNINLWDCNAYSLEQAGIPKEHIMRAEVCTCCESDIFFSHRKTQGKRGTLGAFMRLK